MPLSREPATHMLTAPARRVPAARRLGDGRPVGDLAGSGFHAASSSIFIDRQKSGVVSSSSKRISNWSAVPVLRWGTSPWTFDVTSTMASHQRVGVRAPDHALLIDLKVAAG